MLHPSQAKHPNYRTGNWDKIGFQKLWNCSILVPTKVIIVLHFVFWLILLSYWLKITSSTDLIPYLKIVTICSKIVQMSFSNNLTV